MAKRTRESKWPLLLLGEPGQPVPQIQLSKRTVVWLPAAALFLVAGCFAGLEWNAQHRIHELESRLSAESARLAVAVADKNGEIKSLKRELSDMTRQAGQIKNRFEQVKVSEDKLRLLILESNKRKAEEQQAELNALPSGWPTVSHKVTSRFGYRKDPMTGRSAFHAGIDISGDTGEPVFAAGDGVVKDTGFERARGNYIIITHRHGLESLYLHLRKIGVLERDKVQRGQRIGQLGNTGRSTGPHLHFGIVESDEPVNPLAYLKVVRAN